MIGPGSPTNVVPTDVLHMSGIPHHMDLHPGRNVYSTSWFILSVLFFIGGETSEVPTCVEDSLSHRTLLEYQCLPNQLVHTVYVVFDRQWRHLWSPTILRTSSAVAMSTHPAGSYCWCYLWNTDIPPLDRRWDVCVP